MAATACLAIFVACSAVAAADVIYVKASATGAGDGSSWDDAFTNVRPDLAAAQSGDQVWVAQGTYVGYITLKEGVELYGGLAGNENPAFDLTDRDLEANGTVLDGKHAGNVIIPPPIFAVLPVICAVADRANPQRSFGGSYSRRWVRDRHKALCFTIKCVSHCIVCPPSHNPEYLAYRVCPTYRCIQ